MGVSQYPIHELIHHGEADVVFYRGIANAWALNFLFSDYRLYPNPMGYVYQTYRYSYPSERVQAVKEWLGRPEGAIAFASVLDDSLTREKAEITSVYFNCTGIASGLEIALLQYFRYRVHVSIISADRALPLYSLLRALYKTDNPMAFYAIKAMVG